MRVCFVCTANSCRSPMAEALFRSELVAQGANPAEWEVSSAGVAVAVLLEQSGLSAGTATQAARDAMAAVGLDLSSHRVRQATRPELIDSDLVLVMARGHLAQVAQTAPEALPRTFLLTRFVELGERHPPRSRDPKDRIAELNARRGAPEECLQLGDEADVADPIGMPDPFFVAARDEIGDHVRRAAKILLGVHCE
jgi:low molecular weight protein-tyrosine phosphatase